MLRAAGRIFTQAASLSSTRCRASPSACSPDSHVVSTTILSVTTREYHCRDSRILIVTIIVNIGEEAKLSRVQEIYENQLWDKQFEADVAAGKWDALAEKALKDHQEGNSTPL